MFGLVGTKEPGWSVGLELRDISLYNSNASVCNILHHFMWFLHNKYDFINRFTLDNLTPIGHSYYFDQGRYMTHFSHKLAS